MGNGKYANASGSVDGRDSRGLVVRDPDNLMNSPEYRFVAQPPDTLNGWCDADHSSWLNSVNNPNAPILISRYTIGSSCQFAFTGEIDAAAVDGSNTVWRFAHNHNGGFACYYAQSFAQISNDGRWALFSSYWDGALGADASFGCAWPECFMNLPNSLTILRIFFTPLLVVVLLTRMPNVVFLGVPMNFTVWGVLILLLAAATDWADGFYARRREEITTLGILLDPIADKLLISAAFISLVQMQLVPGWMVVIIIGREITVLGLRNIASAEGFTIPASALGKTKMVLQVVAVCAVIVGAKRTEVRSLGTILVWLVVMSAVASAVQYFSKFWSHVDDRVKQRRHLRLLERRRKAQDAPTL